jgi:hypothetical protein
MVADVVMTAMRNYVRCLTTALLEHARDRPWIVVGQEQRTITLDDAVNFFGWAHEQWPEPRWTIELDPGQLSPAWPRTERA